MKYSSSSNQLPDPFWNYLFLKDPKSFGLFNSHLYKSTIITIIIKNYITICIKILFLPKFYLHNGMNVAVIIRELLIHKLLGWKTICE